MGALREYTREEVAAEAQADRAHAWVVLFGMVFRVAEEYFEAHPGGAEVFRGNTGKDASEDWEEVGHSVRARKKLNEYLVGHIKDHTPEREPQGDLGPTDPQYISKEQALWAEREKVGNRGAASYLPLVILLIAVAFAVAFPDQLTELLA